MRIGDDIIRHVDYRLQQYRMDISVYGSRYLTAKSIIYRFKPTSIYKQESTRQYIMLLYWMMRRYTVRDKHTPTLYTNARLNWINTVLYMYVCTTGLCQGTRSLNLFFNFIAITPLHRPLDNVRLGEKLCCWYPSPRRTRLPGGVSVAGKSELIGWKDRCNDIVIIVIIIDERTVTLTIPVWDWWWRTRASPPVYQPWTFDWRTTVTIKTRTRRSETSSYFSGSVWKIENRRRVIRVNGKYLYIYILTLPPTASFPWA